MGGFTDSVGLDSPCCGVLDGDPRTASAGSGGPAVSGATTAVWVFVLVVSLPAHGQSSEADPNQAPAPPAAQGKKVPPSPKSDNFDWVQLHNGEWLKGEIKDFQDGSFSFESDELDMLQLDWDDVYAVYSTRQNTLLLEDRSEVQGTLVIEGDEVIVTTAEGERRFLRDDLRTIVPGEATEWNYWSGKLSLGAILRRGNVDQSDLSAYASIQRRTTTFRTRLEYTGAFSSVDGGETANNHRGLFTNDYYLTSSLYARLPGFEAYRDRFQNIEYRLTPYAGLGYEIVDDGTIEWAVLAGGGYQYTRFDSVPADDDRTEGTAALLAGTNFTWEATSDIDVEATYAITAPVPDMDEYNHRATVGISLDIWGDFDLDVKLIWDRVNKPAPDTDDEVPEKDDYRLHIGVGWEF